MIPDRLQHGTEHRGREPARVGVVARAVKAVEQRQMRKLVLGAVAKRELRRLLVKGTHGGLVGDADLVFLDLDVRVGVGPRMLVQQQGVTCCYAKADKFWVKDEDGMPWEMYTLLADVEAETADDPTLRQFLGQATAEAPAATKEGACCAPGTSCG